MAQPAPRGSLGLAGAAMGAVDTTGFARTTLLSSSQGWQQDLCQLPSTSVLQHWLSLGALEFVTMPCGRLGTLGLEGNGSSWVTR